MSVVISMLTLVPGGMGGTETYARELLRQLALRDLDVRTLVGPAGSGFSQGVPEDVVGEFPTGASTTERARALVLGMFRRRQLSARLGGADVVHYPFTVPVPSPGGGRRSIVSLHDVQHHDLPDLFTLAERLYRWNSYDRAARQADAVVTVSDFCKRRIVECLGIDAARVHVAHLGVRPEEFAPWLGPRDPFLLYPAKAWRHKNHAGLLDAFRIVRQRNPTLKLVLTGARQDELPPLGPGVEARGLVSRSELIDLYRRASLLVFPSRYEGFGLPPIEAMACGCPVAAAKAGSLPEVVGDAGILFDPDDPDDIARGVEHALDAARNLQERGLERAGRFSWASCASVHDALYRSLGG